MVKSLKILFILIAFINYTNAQDIVCSAKDKELFTQKINELNKDYKTPKSPGETIIFVGKSFLKTPYVEKTLEIGVKESLVINLQGLDCTTYVENVLAFTLMLKNNQSDFDTYTDYLENIRYRNGKLNGYTSRLHYFSEWIANNQQKKLIKNITNDLGGISAEKEINFMSTHRDSYPFLKEQDNFKGIQEVEKVINQYPICYLPKDQIKSQEHLIESGDIIALVTSIKGLDITHTGFAIRETDGSIHLLHASSSGAVKISKLPLTEYLKKIKHNIGIIVSRVQ